MKIARKIKQFKIKQDIITRKVVKRTLITFLILLIIRIGTYIPIPIINHLDLECYIKTHPTTQNLLRILSNDSNYVLNIFTLSIFPYINASIIIQLLMGTSPELAKIQKENNLENLRLVNRVTRVLTLFIAIGQSIGLVSFLRNVLANWNYTLAVEIIIWLTTGAMIILWLGDMIKEYGLGNGTSIIICTNIVATIPTIVKIILSENVISLSFILEVTSLFIICVFGLVFFQEGILKIDLISSKELNEKRVDMPPRNYLPLKYNQSGIMPVILATAILIIPEYLMSSGIVPKIGFIYNNPTIFFIASYSYWGVYFLLILGFGLIYSNIALNPNDLSDKLEKMTVTIKDVKPGVRTVFYLQQVIQRITIIGAFVLALAATLPNFLGYILNRPNLNGLSITSLLIVINIILEVFRDVDNYYNS